MGNYKGFTSVQLRKPKRSKFDLSHEKKLSCRMGQLVPIFCTEVLPNDTVKLNSEVMIRLAPVLAPIFHRVQCFVHHMFVPTRLLYKDWEKFITNGRLGTETPPVPPQIYLDGLVIDGGTPTAETYASQGSLLDYLGFAPIQTTADLDAYITQPNKAIYISPLPVAAYYKVWYDYYRDRNYHADNEILPLLSGDFQQTVVTPDDKEDFLALKYRAWQHDYFTSALPWTQRGDEVLIPMDVNGGGADIIYKANSELRDSTGGSVALNTALTSSPGVSTLTIGSELARVENIDSISLSNTSISVVDLRAANRLQEWLERNAVAGSRYNESIMAHFARRTSDGRLQRAEYLGGGRVDVQISEVMTTAWSQDGTGTDIPPANMSGRGVAYNKTNRIRYNCEEHGFVISIMSIMPTSAYMQGSHRMFWNRNTFLDYPWPSFANIGEQPVATYEIYQSPATVPYIDTEENEFVDGTLFGYQSRYADWKYIPSTVHGEFRTSLDYWHLARKFASAPTLGEQFVTFEDALQDRIFAVAETDTLWCYIYNNCSVVRSLPYFGTPVI